MSEEFQDRLEENEEEIREELELEEEDSKFIWDNITEFCEESDKEVLEDIVYVEEEEPEESADEDKIRIDTGGTERAVIDSVKIEAKVPVQFPTYTTTQRNALSGVANGMVIYNSTTSKFQGRAGGSWVDFH